MVKGGVESQDQVMIRNYRGAAAVHNLAGCDGPRHSASGGMSLMWKLKISIKTSPAHDT